MDRPYFIWLVARQPPGARVRHDIRSYVFLMRLHRLVRTIIVLSVRGKIHKTGGFSKSDGDGGGGDSKRDGATAPRELPRAPQRVEPGRPGGTRAARPPRHRNNFIIFIIRSRSAVILLSVSVRARIVAILHSAPEGFAFRRIVVINTATGRKKKKQEISTKKNTSRRRCRSGWA